MWKLKWKPYIYKHKYAQIIYDAMIRWLIKVLYSRWRWTSSNSPRAIVRHLLTFLVKRREEGEPRERTSDVKVSFIRALPERAWYSSQSHHLLNQKSPEDKVSFSLRTLHCVFFLSFYMDDCLDSLLHWQTSVHWCNKVEYKQNVFVSF